MCLNMADGPQWVPDFLGWTKNRYNFGIVLKKGFNFNLTKNSNSIGFTKKLEMSKNTVIPGVDRSLN